MSCLFYIQPHSNLAAGLELLDCAIRMLPLELSPEELKHVAVRI